jgi:hypothetical protein
MSKKKIILSDEEIAIIEKQLNGQFSPLESTNKERQTFNRIIQSAETLCNELDAYDDVGDSLLQWYYDKYKAQE